MIESLFQKPPLKTTRERKSESDQHLADSN